jgi:hypothetical protein
MSDMKDIDEDVQRKWQEYIAAQARIQADRRCVKLLHIFGHIDESGRDKMMDGIDDRQQRLERKVRDD